jgi:hypothetical protein
VSSPGAGGRYGEPDALIPADIQAGGVMRHGVTIFQKVMRILV